MEDDIHISQEFLNQAEEFGYSLTRQFLPEEQMSIKRKRNVILDQLPPIPEDELDEFEYEEQTRGRDKTADKILKRYVRKWEPIEWSEAKVLEYMISRTAPEYAAVTKIFHEIKKFNPDFSPKSFLSYGNGVGASVWAANNMWSTINEVFCVDTFRYFNDLAHLLLQDGNKNKSEFIKGVFMRQFLPATHETKYDVVISPYSLLSQPSQKARLELVDSLWKKTSKYLIILDYGSRAGFTAVLEARDYILSLTDSDSGRVFSPCPHNEPCPKVAASVTKLYTCQFSTKYIQFSGGKDETVRKEQYTYVVLEKNGGECSGKSWPRNIVEPLLHHHRVTCRTCCPDGTLKELIITKGRHGTNLYQCAKKAKWGDMIPLNVTEEIHST